MNSRERVISLLERRPVDRIPNGLGACETAGLHNLAYHKLKKLLGVESPANRVCTFMCNAIFEPEVLRALEGDIILLGSRMNPSRFWGADSGKEWKPLRGLWDVDLQVPTAWQFRKDADGVWHWGTNVCPNGAFYFDAPVDSPSNLAAFDDSQPQPSPKDFNPPHELPEALLERLAQDAEWLHANTDFAIACGEVVQDLQCKPGGVTAWWMRMASEPEACHEFLGKAVDAALAQLKQLDQAIGKRCQILGIADDMGDSRGVMVGPDLWRTIYKPHYKRLFTEWHKLTKMKVNLHSCGAIADILPDLAECGVDILNPVQVSGKGMVPAALKRLAGDKLTFLGGSFDAIALPSGTPPERVYEQVRTNIKALSAGGGYIFAGVHNLPADIPEGHLRAMLEAYRDSRADKDCLPSNNSSKGL